MVENEMANDDKKKKKKRQHILDQLHAVIVSRRDADPEKSHTASLFARGTDKICEKIGEEATELVIEGVHGRRDGVISESADLVYHMLVLWADQGVDPREVWEALDARRTLSGIEEKAKRNS